MYEIWNLKIPEIPPRARLYPLEPVGKGTPFVEGLTSYILRLADAHTVPVGALVRHELAHLRSPAAPRGRWKDRHRIRTPGVSLNSYSINGLRKLPDVWATSGQKGCATSPPRFASKSRKTMRTLLLRNLFIKGRGLESARSLKSRRPFGNRSPDRHPSLFPRLPCGSDTLTPDQYWLSFLICAGQLTRNSPTEKRVGSTR